MCLDLVAVLLLRDYCFKAIQLTHISLLVHQDSPVFFQVCLLSSCLLSLSLCGTSTSQTFNWEYHTAVTSNSGKSLKYVKDNFLTQVLSEPARKDVLLELLFVNREGLVGDVMVGGCLGHSDHEMIEFKIFDVMRKMGSRVATLDFKRANFGT